MLRDGLHRVVWHKSVWLSPSRLFTTMGLDQTNPTPSSMYSTLEAVASWLDCTHCTLTPLQDTDLAPRQLWYGCGREISGKVNLRSEFGLFVTQCSDQVRAVREQWAALPSDQWPGSNDLAEGAYSPDEKALPSSVHLEPTLPLPTPLLR